MRISKPTLGLSVLGGLLIAGLSHLLMSIFKVPNPQSLVTTLVFGVGVLIYLLIRLSKYEKTILQAVEEESKRKSYVTELQAMDWTTGRMTLFTGAILMANSKEEAEAFCKENMPYLKVVGCLEEDQFAFGPLDNRDNYSTISLN